MEDETRVHIAFVLFATRTTLKFYSVLCKLGHRCFIAAECFETFSYVQWEKKPLKIHAEIIKLFNFTVNLSEQVINLSLYCCFYRHDVSVHFLPRIVWECLSRAAQHAVWKRQHFTEILGRSGNPGRRQFILLGTWGNWALAALQELCTVAKGLNEPDSDSIPFMLRISRYINSPQSRFPTFADVANPVLQCIIRQMQHGSTEVKILAGSKSESSALFLPP